MTTLTHTQEQTASAVGIMPIVLAALAGVFLLYFSNFAGATVLHDAAHDARHALAIPCH
jgi:cobalt transporter subunit CbtB